MATMWAVPKLWPGQTVAILASGSSLSPNVVEAVRRAQLPVVVTNNVFHLAPWADMLYAADAGWWRYHAQEALKFKGLKVTAQSSVEFPAVMCLRNTGTCGFDADPRCIRTGGNSGYQAIHVAMQAGAERILLFGFDMRGGHYHGPHPEPLRNTTEDTFSRWRERFKTLKVCADSRGIEILNCTPGSALECFPPGDLVPEWSEVEHAHMAG